MARVPMKEAAEQLGVSVDTVRRRLKAGELQGVQEPTGGGAFRWLIDVPDDASAAPGGSAEASPGYATADTADLAIAQARIDGLEAMVTELRSERDAWRDQAEADRDAARELRILLRHAQEAATTIALPAEVSEARSQSDHQPAAPADDAPAEPKGFIARLRWLFGG